jgi:hypothetical protein
VVTGSTRIVGPDRQERPFSRSAAPRDGPTIRYMHGVGVISQFNAHHLIVDRSPDSPVLLTCHLFPR